MTRILHAFFLLAVCLFCCFGCSNGGHRELSDFGGYRSRNGTLEAKRDIQRGVPSIKAYGIQAPGTEYYIVLLKQKLNIKYDQIAGCFVDSYLESYADSYNKVIYEYVARKYGQSALDHIRSEALHEFEKKYKKS